MQESEAAQDFSRFLALLTSGNQVHLERDGQSLGTVSLCEDSAALREGNIHGILRTLREREADHGPLYVSEGYTESMQRAHDAFNQPLESRDTWD